MIKPQILGIDELIYKLSELDKGLERLKEIENEVKNNTSKSINDFKKEYHSIVDEINGVFKYSKKVLSEVKKGDKGDKGKDGYTPIKGKDYFDGKDGYTPIKGKDYFDGKDGKDGRDGKDTDEEIIIEKVFELLQSGKKKLSTKHLSDFTDGLEQTLRPIRSLMAGFRGGGDTVVAGTGIAITTNANGNKIISSTGGSGTGDVVGPSSAVADDIATFDGTTGKIIKDGGSKISNLIPKTTLATAKSVMVAQSANTPVELAMSTNAVVGRINGDIVNVPIDSDLSSTSAGDDTVPSAKATKTALDTKVPYTVLTDWKNPTGFVDPDNITVAYNYTNRTITLTHSSNIYYYWNGVKYELGTAGSWTSSAHTDSTGSGIYIQQMGLILFGVILLGIFYI